LLLHTRYNAQMTAKTHFESHISVSSPDSTVIEQLKQNTDLSIQTLKNAKKTLAEGNKLHLYYDEDIQATKPDAAVLIADEGEYSIWNKPYGMYSQGSKWGDQCSIYRWAEQHLEPQRTAFVVHRLDRAASGLIILAHSKKMATVFSDLFKNRKITKIYKAVIAGKLQQLTLPYTINSDIDNKPAVTHIKEQVHNSNDTSTLIIEIETGRKHQIRKHLAEINHPILGDRLYGEAPFENDLQLTACLLEFECPIDKQIKSYSLNT